MRKILLAGAFCLAAGLLLAGCSFVYEKQEGVVQEDSQAQRPFPDGSSEAAVYAGDLSGQGTLVEYGGSAVVVTAAHLFSGPGEDAPNYAEVVFRDGTVTAADVYGLDRELDVAVLSIAEPVSGTVCAVPLPPPDGAEQPAADQTVAVFDREGRCRLGSLVEPDASVENLGGGLLYFLCDVEPGMSGAGIYNETGQYIGMLAGGTVDSRAAGIPVSAVAGFLNTMGSPQ